MKLRKTAAIYSIIVGLGMIGVWLMLLITGQDPQLAEELRTIPFAISMGIASDIITALALLIAGYALLTGRRWAAKMFLLAIGLLLYSVINAAGLYGQRGDAAFTIMFTIIFILAVIFTMAAFRAPAHKPVD
jgi:hypothetical protein